MSDLETMVKTLQKERARIQWYAVGIKCRLQDLKVLCDGILNNKPLYQVRSKLMYEEKDET